MDLEDDDGRARRAGTTAVRRSCRATDIVDMVQKEIERIDLVRTRSRRTISLNPVNIICTCDHQLDYIRPLFSLGHDGHRNL